MLFTNEKTRRPVAPVRPQYGFSNASLRLAFADAEDSYITAREAFKRHVQNRQRGTVLGVDRAMQRKTRREIRKRTRQAIDTSKLIAKKTAYYGGEIAAGLKYPALVVALSLAVIDWRMNQLLHNAHPRLMAQITAVERRTATTVVNVGKPVQLVEARVTEPNITLRGRYPTSVAWRRTLPPVSLSLFSSTPSFREQSVAISVPRE